MPSLRQRALDRIDRARPDAGHSRKDRPPMAKFEVLVFRSTFAEAVIEVDAVDADAAHEAAMERVATDKTIKWKREEPTGVPLRN